MSLNTYIYTHFHAPINSCPKAHLTRKVIGRRQDPSKFTSNGDTEKSACPEAAGVADDSHPQVNSSACRIEGEESHTA